MTNLKALAFAGGALLIGAFSVPALADAGGAAAADQPGGTMTYERNSATTPEHLRNINVKVTGVDSASNTVTFQAQLASKADIEQNGQMIKLDQLKAGDEVRASFDAKTGEILKLQIERPGSLAPVPPAPVPAPAP